MLIARSSELVGYAGMLLTIPGKPAVMSTVGTTPTVVDIFNFVSSQSVDEDAVSGMKATLSPDFTMGVRDTGIYLIAFWASVSLSANNKLLTFTPFINGSTGLVEVDRFLSTGADTGVVSIHAAVPFSADDTIDIRANIDSGTADLTFLAAGFHISRLGP